MAFSVPPSAILFEDPILFCEVSPSELVSTFMNALEILARQKKTNRKGTPESWQKQNEVNLNNSSNFLINAASMERKWIAS